MSEANNSWRFNVDGRPHEVQLSHGTWSGKREVTLDGVVVVDTSKWFDTGSSHTFDVEGHTAEVRIDVIYSGSATPRHNSWTTASSSRCVVSRTSAGPLVRVWADRRRLSRRGVGSGTADASAKSAA